MSNSTQCKPIWARHPMRLDPDHLPQVLSFSGRAGKGEVTITLDRRGAVLRRELARSGLPATIMLPAHVFRGVAARALEEENGEVTVTLELHHTDPSLCVPLLVAGDLMDVAGDWRAWAEVFGLPMLLIEADGVARTLDESLERRFNVPAGHSAVAAPEHRLRMRSAPGALGVRVAIDGRKVTVER